MLQHLSTRASLRLLCLDALAATLLVCPAAEAGPWAVSTAGGESVRIVVETHGSNANFLLERRLADGSLDARFGPRGRVRFDLGLDSDPPASLRSDEQGRLLVVGTTRSANGFRPIVLRLRANGAPDPSWGEAGRSVVSPHEGNAAALDVLPLTDGRVLVLGFFDTEGEQAAAWHLASDGRLDVASGRSSRFVLKGSASSRGVSLTHVDPRQVVLGVRVQDGDDMMLEGHSFDPTDADALPRRISRQLWPPAWNDAPTWSASGRWTDPWDPKSPPVVAVRVAAPASSPWISLGGVAAAPAPVAAVVPAEPGAAAFIPFEARPSSPSAEEIDPRWLAAGLAMVVIAGTVVIVWFRRRSASVDR